MNHLSADPSLVQTMQALNPIAQQDCMAAVVDIVVLGGVNADYLVRATSLPQPGAPAEDEQFVRSRGGEGLNQATAGARLGARTALIGCAGDDAAGDEAIAQLAADDVDVGVRRRAYREPASAVVIQVDRQGRKQTSAALGANQRLAVDQVTAAADTIAKARLLLVQLEVPL